MQYYHIYHYCWSALLYRSVTNFIKVASSLLLEFHLRYCYYFIHEGSNLDYNSNWLDFQGIIHLVVCFVLYLVHVTILYIIIIATTTTTNFIASMSSTSTNTTTSIITILTVSMIMMIICWVFLLQPHSLCLFYFLSILSCYLEK